MSAQLTIFAINSLVRLGHTGIKAFEESARNEALLFPALETIDMSPPVFVTNYFNKLENEHYVIDDNAEYAEFWEYQAGVYSRPKRDPQSIDALLIAITRIEALRGRSNVSPQAGPAAVLVKTWSKGNEPLSAIARIALVGADIALEYVGNNTGAIGGGNGAKLISAYATTLAAALPADGKLSTKEKARETLTGLLLRAGFETISKHPDWITSESHLVSLIESTVTPIAESFPLESDSQIIEFELLRDTIMGPASSALFSAIAENQSALLGEKYSVDKALGAVTHALFINAKTIGIDKQFTQEGLISLFRVTTQEIAKKPALFVDSSGNANNALASDLLGAVADVLSSAEYPFDRQLGIDLAKASLGSISDNVHHFINGDAPWEQSAADLLRHVINEFTPIVGEQGALKSLFSEAQLAEYCSILIEHVGKSPSLLERHQNWLGSGLVNAMAHAMMADTHFLLSANNWIQLAKTAAHEAATNPMRIFSMESKLDDKPLAAELLLTIINSAAEFKNLQGKKSVLFGETLTQAMEIMLHSAAGKLNIGMSKLSEIKQMMQALNEFMNAESAQYGSQAFLIIYRALLLKILSNQDIPNLSQSYVIELLDGVEA